MYNFLFNTTSPSLHQLTYFGLFDGHDGPGAAVLASQHLHLIIKVAAVVVAVVVVGAVIAVVAAAVAVVVAAVAITVNVVAAAVVAVAVTAAVAVFDVVGVLIFLLFLLSLPFCFNYCCLLKVLLLSK